ncbi:MAG: hypothetical protein AAB914_00870 [Patescibacteria group bacterium]
MPDQRESRKNSLVRNYLVHGLFFSSGVALFAYFFLLLRKSKGIKSLQGFNRNEAKEVVFLVAPKPKTLILIKLN